MTIRIILQTIDKKKNTTSIYVYTNIKKTMFITRKLQKFKKVANTDEHDVWSN